MWPVPSMLKSPILGPLETENSWTLQGKPRKKPAVPTIKTTTWDARNANGRTSWRGIEKRKEKEQRERKEKEREEKDCEDRRKREKRKHGKYYDRRHEDDDNYRRDERSDRFRLSCNHSSHHHCDYSERGSGCESEGWTKVSHRRGRHKSNSC